MVAKRPFFSRIDIPIIAALLSAALVFFAWDHLGSSTASVCEVSLDGQTIALLSLTEDNTYTFPQAPGVQVKVEEGAVCFLSSDCPDRTCVRTGWLREPGQYAICLPNRLMISIPKDASEEEGPSVDGITGKAGVTI